MPTFQNPTGATMPLAQRERLVALARAHDLVIIEDDPYSALRYAGEDVPPLRALDPDVIYLGTFSKTVAPGIRVGWMVMPEALKEKMYAIKEAADINSDRVMQQAVCRDDAARASSPPISTASAPSTPNAAPRCSPPSTSTCRRT